MIPGIFEALMLICFAAAWPFSIYRSWVSRTALGKSVTFEYIVLLGYVFGMTNKFVNNDLSYVLIFYVLDTVLVAADMVLYYRNRRLDRARGR